MTMVRDRNEFGTFELTVKTVGVGSCLPLEPGEKEDGTTTYRLFWTERGWMLTKSRRHFHVGWAWVDEIEKMARELRIAPCAPSEGRLVGVRTELTFGWGMSACKYEWVHCSEEWAALGEIADKVIWAAEDLAISEFKKPYLFAECPIVGAKFKAGAADRMAALCEGDELSLEREPNNEHDSNAVVVKSKDGVLGYIPRDYNLEISEHLEMNRRLSCKVIAFTEKWGQRTVIVQVIGNYFPPILVLRDNVPA